MRILFCTGNQGKFEEAVHAIDHLSGGGVAAGRVTVTRCDADPEEIQGDADGIARAKTAAALRVLRAHGHPLETAHDFLCTEDVSFHLSCLNGMPGPYVKDFLEALNEGGLWDLVRRYDDRRATAACRLCVADLRASSAVAGASSPPLLLFTGSLAGGCVAPRGDVRHGTRSWNALFVPDAAEGGDGRTFGEMSLQEQSRMSHRNRAIAAFMQACGPPAHADAA